MTLTSIRPAFGLLVVALLAGGCVTSPEAGLRRTFGDRAPNPALAMSYRIYDGRTGEPVSLDRLVADAEDADAIFFGEHHYEAVCNAFSADLFARLLAQDRPVSLAMEFLTRDQQPAIDAYLAGKTDEAAFQEATGKGRRYLLSHRPLIELARHTDADVLGVGISKKYWSLWRKSGIEAYSEWIETLPADERSSFPRECTQIRDAYWEKIAGFSHGGGSFEGGPSEEELAEMQATQWNFFKTQCLWDDSFAEGMADARERDANMRVYLVVGAFHIQEGLGTITKYVQRRPSDSVLTVSHTNSFRSGYDLSFDESDLGLADYVVYTVSPPEPDPEPEVEVEVEAVPEAEAETEAVEESEGGEGA